MFTSGLWCGPSCGESYCGEWCSDPPACSDPCDRCGNYTGGHGQGGYGNYAGNHGGYGYGSGNYAGNHGGYGYGNYAGNRGGYGNGSGAYAGYRGGNGGYANNYRGGNGNYGGYSNNRGGAYAGARPASGAPRNTAPSGRASGAATAGGNERTVTSRMVSQSEQAVTPAEKRPQPRKAVRSDSAAVEQAAMRTTE